MNFFSKFFNKSSSKEEPKSPESKFLPKKKAAIEERFILKFIENGGKFLYCENLGEVQKNFDLILAENEWVSHDILMINSKLKKQFDAQLEKMKGQDKHRYSETKDQWEYARNKVVRLYHENKRKKANK